MGKKKGIGMVDTKKFLNDKQHDAILAVEEFIEKYETYEFDKTGIYRQVDIFELAENALNLQSVLSHLIKRDYQQNIDRKE